MTTTTTTNKKTPPKHITPEAFIAEVFADKDILDVFKRMANK